MTPVLVGREKPPVPTVKAVAYRGPGELVDEIDQAAREMGLSRNEAMTQLLRFALEKHRAEAKKKPKK